MRPARAHDQSLAWLWSFPSTAGCACLGSTWRLAGEISGAIGYMPENDAHIPGLNAVSFVGYCGELAGLPRADAIQRAHEVLFTWASAEARYRNVDTYSTGMKQRSSWRQALVHDPDSVSRRADERHGSQGARRDAGAVRDLAKQKRQASFCRHILLPDVEYHLRPPSSSWTRGDRHGRLDRSVEATPGAVSTSCASRRLAISRHSSTAAAAGLDARPPTTTSSGCSCRVMGAQATVRC